MERSIGSSLVTGVVALAAALGASAQEGSGGESDDRYALVSHRISLESFNALSPQHQAMLARMFDPDRPQDDSAIAPRAFCFSGPVPDDVMAAFNQHFFGYEKFVDNETQWIQTATSRPGFITAGDEAFTVTYSFVPDGTNMPGDPMVGNPDAPSDLFAFFDAIYGSTAVWQNIFHDMFAAWGAVTGIDFLFEPNDDGAQMPEAGVTNGASGLLGTRGDIRIGGYFIDGQSGPNTVAFNFFPNTGDMFIDTSNTGFYGNLASNSLNLRNLISHELGHGIGLNHVCPVDNTKVMEPIIGNAFLGPQLDDVLIAQKVYGDDEVGNGDTFTATALGAINNTTVTATSASLAGLSEEDFFTFDLSGSQSLEITLTPIGMTYLSGPQNMDGSCSAGTTFDPLEFMNLDLQLIGPDASTVLATANTKGAGLSEGIALVIGPAGAGAHFVRVFAAGTDDEVQAYELSVSAMDFAGPFLSNPQGGGLFELSDPAIVLSFDVSNTEDPTTFEWLKGGVPLVNGGRISGADSAVLTISPPALTDTGAYQLRVSDSAKIVTVSEPISVQVVTAIPVLGPAGLALLAGLMAGIGAAALHGRRRRQ